VPLRVVPLHLLFHAVRTLARIVGHIAGAFLHIAPGVLSFALNLLTSAFVLEFLIAGPLSGLAFHTSLDVFHLSFDFVPIHKFLLQSGWFKAQTTVRRPVRSWKISATSASTSNRCIKTPRV